MIALITSAYDQAELRLLDKVQKLVLLGLDETVAADTLQGKKLAQLRELRQDTITQLRQLAKLDSSASAELLQLFLAGKSVAGDLQGTSSATFNNLIADYTKLLKDARLQILRQTQDAYRSIIGQVIQQSALGISTRIQTARQALDRFADQGITAFVSRDGKQWEIRSYVEMATRSTLHNAQREGRLNNIAGDLIVINSVPNPSPLCKPYERKVLSISGKNDRYPSLASAKAGGLFHPNCRHSFTAYVPGLTQLGKDNNDSDDYEESQQQRYLERQVRKWKRREVVADTSQAKTKAKDKINTYRDKINELVEEFNLVRKRNRESNISAR